MTLLSWCCHQLLLVLPFALRLLWMCHPRVNLRARWESLVFLQISVFSRIWIWFSVFWTFLWTLLIFWPWVSWCFRYLMLRFGTFGYLELQDTMLGLVCLSHSRWLNRLMISLLDYNVDGSDQDYFFGWWCCWCFRVVDGVDLLCSCRALVVSSAIVIAFNRGFCCEPSFQWIFDLCFV